MNRKVLYVIIAVLALILIAGLIFVFVAPGMQTAAPQADSSQTDAPQSENGSAEATGDSVSPDAPAADAADPEAGDAPAADVPEQTEETVQQTEAVEPTEESVPEDTRLIPDVPEIEAPAEEEMTYEKYHSMSGDEQAAFINSFDSYEAFFQWYNAAEEKYKEDMIPIDGSTPIDLGGNP